MDRKLILGLLALSLLVACGDDPLRRGSTGAGFGVGTALLMAGNPLLGAAVGAGIGAATSRDQVDFGNAPL